jgi:hypothetical protein
MVAETAGEGENNAGKDFMVAEAAGRAGWC